MQIVATTHLYLPIHTDSVGIDFSLLDTMMTFDWINPATGEMVKSQTIIDRTGLGSRTITPLDTNDWLLVATRITIDDTTSDVPHHPMDMISVFRVGDPVPNPCVGTATIRCELPVSGMVRVVWFDGLGMRVAEWHSVVPKGSVEITTDDLPPGVCLARLVYVPEHGEQQVWTGQVISLR